VYFVQLSVWVFNRFAFIVKRFRVFRAPLQYACVGIHWQMHIPVDLCLSGHWLHLHVMILRWVCMCGYTLADAHTCRPMPKWALVTSPRHDPSMGMHVWVYTGRCTYL
jgi:hypothetical protein